MDNQNELEPQKVDESFSTLEGEQLTIEILNRTKLCNGWDYKNQHHIVVNGGKTEFIFYVVEKELRWIPIEAVLNTKEEPVTATFELPFEASFLSLSPSESILAVIFERGLLLFSTRDLLLGDDIKPFQHNFDINYISNIKWIKNELAILHSRDGSIYIMDLNEQKFEKKEIEHKIETISLVSEEKAIIKMEGVDELWLAEIPEFTIDNTLKISDVNIPSDYKLISLSEISHDNFYILTYMFNGDLDKDYIRLINYIGKFVSSSDNFKLKLIEDDNSYLQFKKSDFKNAALSYNSYISSIPKHGVYVYANSIESDFKFHFYDVNDIPKYISNFHNGSASYLSEDTIADRHIMGIGFDFSYGAKLTENLDDYVNVQNENAKKTPLVLITSSDGYIELYGYNHVKYEYDDWPVNFVVEEIPDKIRKEVDLNSIIKSLDVISNEKEDFIFSNFQMDNQMTQQQIGGSVSTSLIVNESYVESTDPSAEWIQQEELENASEQVTMMTPDSHLKQNDQLNMNVASSVEISDKNLDNEVLQQKCDIDENLKINFSMQCNESEEGIKITINSDDNKNIDEMKDEVTTVLSMTQNDIKDEMLKGKEDQMNVINEPEILHESTDSNIIYDKESSISTVESHTSATERKPQLDSYNEKIEISGNNITEEKVENFYIVKENNNVIVNEQNNSNVIVEEMGENYIIEEMSDNDNIVEKKIKDYIVEEKDENDIIAEEVGDNDKLKDDNYTIKDDNYTIEEIGENVTIEKKDEEVNTNVIEEIGENVTIEKKDEEVNTNVIEEIGENITIEKKDDDKKIEEVMNVNEEDSGNIFLNESYGSLSEVQKYDYSKSPDSKESYKNYHTNETVYTSFTTTPKDSSILKESINESENAFLFEDNRPKEFTHEDKNEINKDSSSDVEMEDSYMVDELINKDIVHSFEEIQLNDDKNGLKNKEENVILNKQIEIVEETNANISMRELNLEENLKNMEIKDEFEDAEEESKDDEILNIEKNELEIEEIDDYDTNDDDAIDDDEDEDHDIDWDEMQDFVGRIQIRKDILSNCIEEFNEKLKTAYPDKQYMKKLLTEVQQVKAMAEKRLAIVNKYIENSKYTINPEQLKKIQHLKLKQKMAEKRMMIISMLSNAKDLIMNEARESVRHEKRKEFLRKFESYLLEKWNDIAERTEQLRHKQKEITKEIVVVTPPPSPMQVINKKDGLFVDNEESRMVVNGIELKEEILFGKQKIMEMRDKMLEKTGNPYFVTDIDIETNKISSTEISKKQMKIAKKKLKDKGIDAAPILKQDSDAASIESAPTTLSSSIPITITNAIENETLLEPLPPISNEKQIKEPILPSPIENQKTEQITITAPPLNVSEGMALNKPITDKEIKVPVSKPVVLETKEIGNGQPVVVPQANAKVEETFKTTTMPQETVTQPNFKPLQQETLFQNQIQQPIKQPEEPVKQQTMSEEKKEGTSFDYKFGQESQMASMNKSLQLGSLANANDPDKIKGGFSSFSANASNPFLKSSSTNSPLQQNIFKKPQSGGSTNIFEEQSKSLFGTGNNISGQNTTSFTYGLNSSGSGNIFQNRTSVFKNTLNKEENSLFKSTSNPTTNTSNLINPTLFQMDKNAKNGNTTDDNKKSDDKMWQMRG